MSLTETTDGRGVATVYNASGTTMVKAYANTGTAGGEVDVHNSNGTATAKLYGGNSTSGGSLTLLNASESKRAVVGVSSNGQGVVQLYDTSGNAYTLTPAKIGEIGQSVTLLWTNASPTSSFAAQTISLDLSSYSAVVVVCTYNTSTQRDVSNFCQVGRNGFVSLIWGDDNVCASRQIYTSTSGVGFSSGYARGSTSNDGYMVPVYIYGIK